MIYIIKKFFNITLPTFIKIILTYKFSRIWNSYKDVKQDEFYKDGIILDVYIYLIATELLLSLKFKNSKVFEPEFLDIIEYLSVGDKGIVNFNEDKFVKDFDIKNYEYIIIIKIKNKLSELNG